MNNESKRNMPYQIPLVSSLNSFTSYPNLYGLPTAAAYSLQQIRPNYYVMPEQKNANSFPLYQQQCSMSGQAFPHFLSGPGINSLPMFPYPALNSIHNAQISGNFSDRLSPLLNIYQQCTFPCPQTSPNAIVSTAEYHQSINTIQPTQIQEPHLTIPIIKKEGILPAINRIQTNDDSVGDAKNDTVIKRLLAGEAYKSRNVYKTIVRHMHTYTRKNREDIIKIILNAGFSMTQVEHAFFKIDYWCNLERENGNRNYAQGIVKKIFAKKTIYTLILRETLNTLLHCWNLGDFGKITRKNREIYMKACQKFYAESVAILGQPAQGISFQL